MKLADIHRRVTQNSWKVFTKLGNHVSLMVYSIQYLLPLIIGQKDRVKQYPQYLLHSTLFMPQHLRLVSLA